MARPQQHMSASQMSSEQRALHGGEQDEMKVDSENKHGTGQEKYCWIPLCFHIPVIIDDIIVQSYWQIAVSCTEKSQRTIFVIKLCLQQSLKCF